MEQRNKYIFIIGLVILGVILGLYITGRIGFCFQKPEMCYTLYDPVFGIPRFKESANDCVACQESNWFWIKI